MLHASRRASFVAGQSVLVFGVGAIGALACALARALGASRVCAVDINAARRAGYTGLDIDMDSDDDGDEELGRPLVRNPVVFDADSDGADRRPPPKTMTPMPMLANSGPPDDEDMWAGLG